MNSCQRKIIVIGLKLPKVSFLQYLENNSTTSKNSNKREPMLAKENEHVNNSISLVAISSNMLVIGLSLIHRYVSIMD